MAIQLRIGYHSFLGRNAVSNRVAHLLSGNTVSDALGSLPGLLQFPAGFE